jgi:membrane-associated phospholipid phosphatase
MQASSLDRRPEPEPDEPPPPDADPIDSQRARAALSVLVTLYALAIALLYALGQFGFFWKTVVVPSLFIVAYLARRFTAFVRDWSVFLCAVVLFDSVRGLVYGVTLHFQRPMYMGYAIELERTLFGAPVPSSRMQQALTDPSHIGTLEKLLVVVHASHFLAFLLFALLLWIVRPPAFTRFRLAMLLVMYSGLVMYLLIPTVPPWMAASRYFVLEPVRHIPAAVYNLSVPTLAESFDVNPVAAMPSLHAAFPTLLALICLETFGAWGLVMAVYACSVCFAIVFLGEHYIVDVMCGTTLALVAFVIVFRTRAFAYFLRPSPLSGPGMHEGSLWQRALRLRRPLLIAAVLLVLAQTAGLLARAYQGKENPTEDFVARELDGKSPMAAYYHGLNAYYAGDFARARHFMAQAVNEVPDPGKRLRAHALLGESAFHTGDTQTAARELGSQSKLSPEQALMLAEARLQLGQREQGFEVLDFVARTYPDDRALQAHKVQLERRYSRAN